MLLVSHDRALLDAIAERTLAIEDGELKAYDGGWADLVRRREELAARKTASDKLSQAKVVQEKLKPAPAPKKKRPSELEKLEAAIALQEAEVAELEKKLAEDWTDVDAVAAHKRSRDALTALLERWEQLFEASSRS